MGNKIILEIPMYVCPNNNDLSYDIILEFDNFFIVEEYDYNNRDILFELFGKDNYFEYCRKEIQKCKKIKNDFNNVSYMECFTTEEKLFYINLKYGNNLNHLIKKEY